MEQAKPIAAKVGDLPPLSHIASPVVELVSNPNSNATDLERLISRDQGLAVRALKIANSTLFGRRGTISTVSRVVVTLGLKTVHSLVNAASTEALFHSGGTNFKD